MSLPGAAPIPAISLENDDYVPLREWATRMAREHRGPAAATYYELAMLLTPPKLEPEGGEPDGH